MLELGRRPKLRAIPLLKCPYCLKEPLRKTWFSFREGCPKCHYRFEREPGYYLGSPWMINYPSTAVICFLVTYFVFKSFPDLHSLIKAAFITFIGVSTSLALYPFSRAIWLVGDHFLNPLTKRDEWDDVSGNHNQP